MYSILDKIYERINTTINYDAMTLGIVVDGNDPQQMGRLRVDAPPGVKPQTWL